MLGLFLFFDVWMCLKIDGELFLIYIGYLWQPLANSVVKYTKIKTNKIPDRCFRKFESFFSPFSYTLHPLCKG